ncbi:AAA family ATPase [Ideonella sp. DXS29W]|uniref:AAA family ATPase n=1 Tax=Ideonella lacteola TaxID=2984193 RepID=A0ABU9BJ31_9BURK
MVIRVDSEALQICLLASTTGQALVRAEDTAERQCVPLERKAAAAIFLAATGAARTREQVARWLWPQSAAAAARTNLRVMLHRLRETLGATTFAAGNDWALASDVQCDLGPLEAIQFEPGLARQLLRNPVLSAWSFDDLPDVESVIEQYRRQAQAAAVQSLLDRAEQAAGPQGQPESAIAWAQAVLDIDPTHERAFRIKMKGQWALGDRAGALATYEACRTVLAEEFGTSPDRATRALQLDILDAHAKPAAPASPPVELEFSAEAAAAEAPPVLRLVGRQTQLNQMEAALRAGRHVWLQGEAGIGKSRLIEEIVSRRSTVRVACRPNDDSRPYALIKRLIGRLVQDPEGEVQISMAKLLRSADLGAELAAEGASIGEVDLESVVNSTIGCLRRLRRDGVELVAIDDLHYIDEASSKVVVELCDVLADASVAEASPLPSLILASREHHQNAACQRVEGALKPFDRFEPVRLQALTKDSTRELLDQLPAPWIDKEEVLERAWKISGGNPFFLTEIVRHARFADQPDALDVQPDSVVTLLAHRLGSATPAARDVAALVALAGVDFMPAMLREVLRLEEPKSYEAWRELMRLGLFNHRGFVHDLACAAAQSNLVGPLGMTLSDAIARCLQAAGAGDERIAHHLLNSSTPQRAAPYVLRAAVTMFGDSLYPEALALIDRLFDAVPSVPQLEEAFDLAWYRHRAMRLCLKMDRLEPSIELLGRLATTDDQDAIAAIEQCRWVLHRWDVSDEGIALLKRHYQTIDRHHALWPSVASSYALALVLSPRREEAMLVYEQIADIDSSQMQPEYRHWHISYLALFELEAGQMQRGIERMQAYRQLISAEPVPQVMRVQCMDQLTVAMGCTGRRDEALALSRQCAQVASRRGVPPGRRIAATMQQAYFLALDSSWGAAPPIFDALADAVAPPSMVAEWHAAKVMQAHVFGQGAEMHKHLQALRRHASHVGIGARPYTLLLSAQMEALTGTLTWPMLEEYLDEASDRSARNHYHQLMRLLRCDFLPPMAASQEAHKALAFFEETDNDSGRLVAWLELARACLAAHSRAEALGHLRRALEVAPSTCPCNWPRVQIVSRLLQALYAAGHPEADAIHRGWRDTFERRLDGLDEARKAMVRARHPLVFGGAPEGRPAADDVTVPWPSFGEERVTGDRSGRGVDPLPGTGLAAN